MTKYFSLLIISLFFLSCGSGSKPASNSSVAVKTDAAVKKQPASAVKTDSVSEHAASTTWVYSEKEDKMTSGKKYYATVDANDLLQFDFPYDGGSTATLTLRKSGGENEALLSVSKGQFHSDVDGTTIKIRFDKEQPLTFGASSASDGSTDVIFISNTKKLIKKLKSAQKIIISAEFYDAGFKEMEFNVAGLKWEH